MIVPLTYAAGIGASRDNGIDFKVNPFMMIDMHKVWMEK
jgi:hypothetical protein